MICNCLDCLSEELKKENWEVQPWIFMKIPFEKKIANTSNCEENRKDTENVKQHCKCFPHRKFRGSVCCKIRPKKNLQ